MNTIDRIRNESIEKLSDPYYLEYKLLPELGLNDRHMHQYPSHLHPYCGNGINSWQYPNQFAHYLHYLSKQKIKSYCEIGCHKGGTFIITVEYLNRFYDMDYALAVDPWERHIMHEYADFNSDIVNYMVCSSESESFKDVYKSMFWDLTLVDGDHSYGAVKKDWELVKDNSTFVAFHDIRNILCPGTQQMWADVKKEVNHTLEWTDQYDEVLLRMRGSIMGIGLVVS